MGALKRQQPNADKARAATKPPGKGKAPGERGASKSTQRRVGSIDSPSNKKRPSPAPPHRGPRTAVNSRPRREKAPDVPRVVETRRAGTVALVGRPNVGKSTLLNAVLGHPLSIISPTPQTTRDAILGVVHHGGAELRILDTPGLHRPRSELGRFMNETARDAARSADVVVFVTDVDPPKPAASADVAGKEIAVHPSDATLLADIGQAQPTVLVVNKVDRLRDKRRLLPLLTALGKLRDFAAIVPVSARRRDGLGVVLDEVAKHCPEQPWQFGVDDMTDRPTRFFAGEYIREQILRATAGRGPHAVAVTIDRFVEPSRRSRSCPRKASRRRPHRRDHPR